MILAIKRAIEVAGIKAQVVELDKGLYVAFGKKVKTLKGEMTNPFCKILMSYGIQPSVEFGEYQEEPAVYINLTGKSTLTFPYAIKDQVRNILDPWVDWDKTPSYFASVTPRINIVAGDTVDKAIKAVLKDEDIQAIIRSIRAQYPTYGLTNGSCISIAKILHKLFGGEIWFLASYSDEDGWSFKHAWCRIKGHDYDGSGRTSEPKILEKFGDSSQENKIAPATAWGVQLDYLLKANHDGFLDYHEIKLIQDIMENASKGVTQRVNI